MKKNFFVVVTSNMLTLIMSLVLGLVLPKYLTVEHYAYFRIYQLYVTYAGFFHFGLVNGIYLKYGNKEVDELPVNTFRMYGKVMYLLQIFVAIIMLGILFLVAPNDINEKIAFAFTIVNIPFINIKWFYSSINQFTKRFVKDSEVTYIQNILQCIMVISVVVFKLYEYVVLLIGFTIINFLSMVMVIFQNRQFANPFGVLHEKLPKDASIRGLISNGFFFMLSEFVAIIILGIDSVFVQNLFSLQEFAMYSFAVSIVTVIYGVITTVANLIYPYLVRVHDSKYSKYYILMSDGITAVTLLAMLAFYIAKFIVVTWIDKYIPSLEIAAVLFGTIVFRTLLVLVCGNFYKVLQMTKEYAQNNFFAIILAFFSDLLAYLIWGDYKYIAYASLVSFIIWYLVTDIIFIKKLKLNKLDCVKRYCCIGIVLLLFYGLFKVDDIKAFVIYFVGSIVVSLLFFGKHLRKA